MGILHILRISTWERGNNWHHFLLLVLGKFGLISTGHHDLQSKDLLEGGISPCSSVCPVSSVFCTQELRMCWVKQALWNFPRSAGSPVTLAPLSLSPWEAHSDEVSRWEVYWSVSLRGLGVWQWGKWERMRENLKRYAIATTSSGIHIWGGGLERTSGIQAWAS